MYHGKQSGDIELGMSDIGANLAAKTLPEVINDTTAFISAFTHSVVSYKKTRCLYVLLAQFKASKT